MSSDVRQPRMRMPLERGVDETAAEIRRDVLLPSMAALGLLAVGAVAAPSASMTRAVILGLGLGLLGGVAVFLLRLHVSTGAFAEERRSGVRSVLRFGFLKWIVYAAFLVPGFYFDAVFSPWAVVVGVFVPKAILVITQIRHIRRDA